MTRAIGARRSSMVALPRIDARASDWGLAFAGSRGRRWRRRRPDNKHRTSRPQMFVNDLANQDDGQETLALSVGEVPRAEAPGCVRKRKPARDLFVCVGGGL